MGYLEFMKSLALATGDTFEKSFVEYNFSIFFQSKTFTAELKVGMKMPCEHIFIWMEIINGIALIWNKRLSRKPSIPFREDSVTGQGASIAYKVREMWE